jgi:hypothetical protein
LEATLEELAFNLVGDAVETDMALRHDRLLMLMVLRNEVGGRHRRSAC